MFPPKRLLQKSEFETLRNYCSRAESYFNRCQLEDDKQKTYNFLIGLSRREHYSVAQAIRPHTAERSDLVKKNIDNVTWAELVEAINKLEPGTGNMWYSSSSKAPAGVPKDQWGNWGLDRFGFKLVPKGAESNSQKESNEKTVGETTSDEKPQRPAVLTPEGPYPFLLDIGNVAANKWDAILEAGSSPVHWNRLTIKGAASLSKGKVLAAIFRVVKGKLLWPTLYQTDENDAFFLFRDGKVIKDFITEGFKLKTSLVDEPLVITMHLRYLSVDEEPFLPDKAIEGAVFRRIHVENELKSIGTVDLRNFQNDPDLKNVYVTLHSIAHVRFITSQITRKVKKLEALVLSHNGLEKLESLEVFKLHLGPIKTIDLRYNKITYSGFETVKFLDVRHLLLEGNPLVDDYGSVSEMMYDMKKMYPHLEYLDGVEINHIMDNKFNMKVYVRNLGYENMVDHFLHHYYELFEKDRTKLLENYHRNASISFSVCRNDRTPVPSSFFGSSNRNMITMSDVTKTYDSIFMGKERVDEALKSMPEMMFDPYSFHVDVPVTAKGGIVVISCTGAFCLQGELPSRVYTFSRIFIISPFSNGLGEWKIINDMWTLMNALPGDVKDSEFFKRAKHPARRDFAVMLNPLLKDKDILFKVVSDLTNLKSAWVKKYLSDSGWDLECTVLSFIDQYKANLIPPEAFAPFTPTPAPT